MRYSEEIERVMNARIVMDTNEAIEEDSDNEGKLGIDYRVSSDNLEVEDTIAKSKRIGEFLRSVQLD